MHLFCFALQLDSAMSDDLIPSSFVLNFSTKLLRLRIIAEDDILVRDELEGLAKEFPDRFKLHYTLDRPPKSWAYSTGFISKEMLQEHMLFNGSSKDTQVFMCGPPPMIKFACLPNLTELGFTEKQWFSF